MEIKTTMGYFFTPIRMTIIKKKKKGITSQECGNKEIGTFIHCPWEYKIVQPLKKTI